MIPRKKFPSAKEIMFVSSKLIPDAEVDGKRMTFANGKTKLCGILPVFRTREDARRFSSDAEIFEISTAP